MLLFFLLGLGALIVLMAAFHGRPGFGGITGINNAVTTFLQNRWSDARQLLWVLAIIALIIFGLVVASMTFCNPGLTVVVLVMLTGITFLLTAVFESFKSTTGLANRLFNGLGSLLVYAVTLIVVNQVWALTHGTGILTPASGEEWLIIVSSIIGFFLIGSLLGTPPQQLWRWCRRVIVACMVFYFIGYGTLAVEPIRSWVRFGKVLNQNYTTRTQINTEQKSLFGELLGQYKEQIKTQKVVEVFVDLRDFSGFVLPVRNEDGEQIDFVEHAESVLADLKTFKDFPALVVHSQSDDRIRIQKRRSDGIGNSGYITLKKGNDDQGFPLYFLVEEKPGPRTSPETLQVKDEGYEYDLDLQNGGQFKKRGEAVIKSGKKVRVLQTRRSPLSGDKFTQILVEDEKGGFEGQTPVWFRFEQLESLPPANPGGKGENEGPPKNSSSAKKFVLRNGGRTWTVHADGQEHLLHPLQTLGDGEEKIFQVEVPTGNFNLKWLALYPGNVWVESKEVEPLSPIDKTIGRKGSSQGSGRPLGVKIWPK